MKRGEKKGKEVKKMSTRSDTGDTSLANGYSGGYTVMLKVVIIVLVVIATLPSAYEALPRNRRGVHMHSCGIPAVCRCMTDLAWVDCSNSDLAKMPDFPRYIYLTTTRLFVNGNRLSSIPDSDYWNMWKLLESADFTGNPVCQDSEVTVMGDRMVEVMSELCPTKPPTTTTTTTTTEQPPEPSKRRRPPFMRGGNGTTTTTTRVTTTTTTTTVYTTEMDDEGETTTEPVTNATTTPTTTTTERNRDNQQTIVDKNRERIIMIGSLSVSVPLGFAAITCCLRGFYKRVTKRISRPKSEKEMAKEAREEIRRSRRRRGPSSLRALFDCECNSWDVDTPPHFENPHFNFSIGEEDEEEEEEKVVFTNQPKYETVRMRTPSLSKEE